jgi:hypothetical protein
MSQRSTTSKTQALQTLQKLSAQQAVLAQGLLELTDAVEPRSARDRGFHCLAIRLYESADELDKAICARIEKVELASAGDRRKEARRERRR